MIDTLVSRHIDALGEWEDHLRQRKTERTASYRPNAAGALGRKPGQAGPSKYFTLSAKLKTWCVVACHPLVLPACRPRANRVPTVELSELKIWRVCVASHAWRARGALF